MVERQFVNVEEIIELEKIPLISLQNTNKPPKLPSMTAKTRGIAFEASLDIYIVSMYLPHKRLITKDTVSPKHGESWQHNSKRMVQGQPASL